jgi:hypothetical protein
MEGLTAGFKSSSQGKTAGSRCRIGKGTGRVCSEKGWSVGNWPSLESLSIGSTRDESNVEEENLSAWEGCD